MTNGEKYKTAEERSAAFRKFCSVILRRSRCAKCPLRNSSSDKCEFEWLDLEYKEELKPCPFCGMTAVITNDYDKYRVHCLNCFGTTSHVSSPDEAIAAWNRRHNEAN